MTGGLDHEDYRDAFAPEVSPARRRHLAAADADTTHLYSAVLGGLLALLFGVAGVVVLVAGVLPPHASAAFRLVAGGGCLAVALLAAVSAIRSAVAEWHLRAADHNGQYLSGYALTEHARQDAEVGDLLRRTQGAAARIRAGEMFADGTLAGAVDRAALDRAEWTLVSSTYHNGARRDLARQVAQLEELADTAGRIEAAVAEATRDPNPPSGSVGIDALADALDRANARAAALESLVSPPRKAL